MTLTNCCNNLFKTSFSPLDQVNMLWFLTVILIITICIIQSNTFSCNNPTDCELNGDCVNNICQCHSGWKGTSCSSLNLTVAPYPALGVWPLSPAHAKETCYSWGFTVVKSQTNVDNLYHAYANAGCYNRSDPAQHQVDGSFLLHLTSSSPTGPFKAHDVAIPMTSFNPHIIYSHSMKQYVLFFRINQLTPMPYCFGNETYSDYVSDLRANTMDVAVSDSPYGPWNVSVITIENMPRTHISNPSAIELANGTFVLSYRFNTNNEWVGIAISKGDYRGPYVNIANLSVAAEDPFLWQNKNDGSFHMIFHAMSSAQRISEWPSLHAFSTNLYDWTVSKSWDNWRVGAYPTNVTWNNGNVTTFFRRERPEIMFDDHGAPLFFYSAVQQFANDSHFGYSYSVVQNIF
eukprot:87238_1